MHVEVRTYWPSQVFLISAEKAVGVYLLTPGSLTEGLVGLNMKLLIRVFTEEYVWELYE